MRINSHLHAGDLLAQRGLQHLAGIVLRQLGEENIRLGPLETRDVLQAQGVELPREQSNSGGIAGDDAGDDLLAPVRVPAAHDRDLRDRGVLLQYFLDLARVDIGSAADDQILGAVLEREEAVAVDAADVARVQPAAGQRRRARLWIHPVALHDGWPAHAYLAD